VPCCRIVDSGWDHGNWFVLLHVDKAEETKLGSVQEGGEATAAKGPEFSLPAMYTRTAPRMTDYV
jgi:hypothetical protein